MYTPPKVYSFTHYLFIYLSTHVFSVSIPQRITLFSIHWLYFLRMSFFFYKIEIDCWCFKINVYFPMRGEQRANNTCNTSQVNSKQLFGNNQYTKQPKYEHNRNTTFSGNQFTKQANTNKHNFLLSPIYNTFSQQFTTQANIN